MSTAVELALAMRTRRARAALEAQRAANVALKAASDAAAKNEKGDKGEKGDKPDHEWVGTGLRFERPDGTWGDLVDLRGPKGPRSSTGGGSGIGVLSALPLPVADTDYLVIQRAGHLHRVTVATLKEVFGEGQAAPGGALLTEAGDVLMTESGDYLVQD